MIYNRIKYKFNTCLVFQSPVVTWIKLIYGPIFNKHNTQLKKKQFEENLRGSIKYLLIEFRELCLK